MYEHFFRMFNSHLFILSCELLVRVCFCLRLCLQWTESLRELVLWDGYLREQNTKDSQTSQTEVGAGGSASLVSSMLAILCALDFPFLPFLKAPLLSHTSLFYLALVCHVT